MPGPCLVSVDPSVTNITIFSTAMHDHDYNPPTEGACPTRLIRSTERLPPPPTATYPPPPTNVKPSPSLWKDAAERKSKEASRFERELASARAELQEVKKSAVEKVGEERSAAQAEARAIEDRYLVTNQQKDLPAKRYFWWSSVIRSI